MRTAPSPSPPARRLGATVVLVGAAALWTAAPTPSLAQNARATPSLAQCDAVVNDEALLEAMFSASRASISDASGRINFDAIVRRSWIAVRFDARFRAIVDEKIAILRADRSYFARLLDANHQGRAEEVVTRVTDLVFQAEAFTALQAELEAEISERLTRAIGDAQLAAESDLLACVQTYLGARYSEAVQDAFRLDIRRSDLDAEVGQPSVSNAVAFNVAGAVTGILAVVFRRLAARVVQRIVSRLIGVVATRFAAMATGVGGAALITYELVTGAGGVFPDIRRQLLSSDTKETMQTALINDLEATSRTRLDTAAGELASVMFQRWAAFQANHAAVLTLAEAEPGFAAFLATLEPERFESLSAVVFALKGEGGDAAVLAALESGVLARAVMIPRIGARLEALGPEGVTVAELVDWRDMSDAVFADAALYDFPEPPDAEAVFERVIRYGLPQRADPANFGADGVGRILELGDAQTAGRVASLAPEARREMLQLPLELRRQTAARFDAVALERMFAALGALDDRDRLQVYVSRIVSRAADEPGVLDRLDSRSVAAAVADSRSPAQAIDILLDPASTWSPVAFIDHVGQVVDGAVDPMVLVSRYGWGLAVGLGLPLLVVLGLVRSVGGAAMAGGRRLAGRGRRNRDRG